MSQRFQARGATFLACCLGLLGASCGDDQPVTGDAGTDAGAPRVCPPFGLEWSHVDVGVTEGASRRVRLELTRSYCVDTTVTITASDDGIASLDTESVTFEVRQPTARDIVVTGDAVGTVTFTATAQNADGETFTDTLEVVVSNGELPACDGTANGEVTAGGSVGVTTGSLTGSTIAVPEGASRDDTYHVDAFDVSIACAADIVPDGFVALGPAVAFTSAEAFEFSREIDFAVPASLALLPSLANRGHVEFAYVGPSIDEPRIVPIANPYFTGTSDAGIAHFLAPRLGTYQAVVRADAPAERTREFQFRAILGFSMGGSGSGRIGAVHPEMFDFVAPLGGPTDWQYLLEYIRSYHLGGFCTEAEREGGATCNAASAEHAPPRDELYEHAQDFEHWWYEDQYSGQGGTFNRTDYLEIFRDLSAMFGNANTDASEDPDEPSVVPPGMPDEDRMLSREQRCTAEHLAMRRIAPEPAAGDADAQTGWFDDEYNPEGQYPVIAFCDGQERADDDGSDVGNWDPTGTPYFPVEVAYAVDVNGNGVRDAGEPVIRNGREPFDDFGADGVRSAMETGYHAVTNPDPGGDDYDFQYNPTGTEGDWEWQEGEHFDDFGLDGVDGTPQLADEGYDRGEGNGTFDRTRGAERMIETSPRSRIRNDAELAGYDYMADGGVRDLFNWVVMGHHTMGAWVARERPVRFYNGHAAMMLGGSLNDDDFDFARMPVDELGRYTMVRYGSIDASEAKKIAGDGGHVGTNTQLLNRVLSSLTMMSQRWPDGDRTPVSDTMCADAEACDHVNNFLIDFESPTTGRRGPAQIVLPPGYFAPENADVRYPVVYFLHGYGMEPKDLAALGIVLWNYMTSPTLPQSRRTQKMIFVFPDGQCANDECLKGTFYTNAPESTPGGAQMETFLLDLMEHVDTTYRTRRPEEFTVTE